MTDSREKLLRTAQRKMLRWIVGTGRKSGTTNHGATARTKEEKHEGKEKEGGMEVQLMEDEEEEEDVQEEGSEEENDEPSNEEIVDEEPWVDWIRRATRNADSQFEKAEN